MMQATTSLNFLNKQTPKRFLKENWDFFNLIHMLRISLICLAFYVCLWALNIPSDNCFFISA